MTDEILEPEKPKRAAQGAKSAEEMPRSIGEIIPLVRREVGPIAKDQKASGGGANYAFRGHDQIVNAVAPIFDKYGVYVTVEDTLLEYGGRNAGTKYATHAVIAKKVTFHAPDGSNTSSTIVSESVDYGNKAVGQSSTYAYRIALTQTLTLPTGEADPDSRNEEFAATDAPAQAAAQPTAPTEATDAIKALKGRVSELFAARGVDKSEIPARGTAFFSGREGWDGNVAALNKLIKALENGEDI